MHFAGPTLQHQGLGKSSANDNLLPFNLSQYSPIGVQHFSAQYRDDPKALEKLSRRICARVEQDSSDLITFCDKRIRKRRKKAKQDEEEKQRLRSRSRSGSRKQYQQLENDGLESSAPAPEVVKASDLLLGTCLGQGSFSSVFVLEKHLHRRSSAANAPRRGRRSKLAHGTNQGSTSSRGASIGNVGDSSVSNRSSTKSRTGRRRLRQLPCTNDHKNSHGTRDGSHRSETNDSSSSSRSRSLSMPRTYKCLNKHHNLDANPSTPISPRSNNDSCHSSRSRSLSSSLRNGIRAVFRRKEKDSNNSNSNHSSVHHDSPLPNKSKRSSHSLRRRDRSEDNSIFRGGSRSLSCRRRKSRTRRSKSRDGLANTTSTAMTDYSGDRDSTNSDDDDVPRSTHKGVLWKNFDASDDNSDNSNLVVKILQPKLMDQPKLFANCAAGLIREGLFLASLDHPHVLKVHAWTSPNGWMDFAALSIKEGDLYDGYLLVLERLKGGSLKGWMHKWQKEHREEQQAIAAVSAMEAAEEKKRERSQRRSRPRKPGRLSFTSSSSESASLMSMSNHSNRLRHTILKKKDLRSASCSSPRPSPEEVSPTQFIDTGGRSERSFPYTSKCPTTQLSDRASLLLQLSDTVKYLHKHRILHRDLKPDNLGVTFVDDHGDSKQKNYPTKMSLKIFDFDIARLVPEEDPKEVNLLSYLSSSAEKKKHKRSSSSGSVRSWDPETMNRESEVHDTATNRAGRSISPFRTSTSSTGEPATLRRRTKGKYRGQRPRPQSSQQTAVVERPRTYHGRSTPEDITPDHSSSETPRDTLFEMTAKMGSPRYMAPEIARGEPYNLKSEVYTVALLIHEVLTLQKPYDELQPEDHGKLVHFDLPGYRPPIYPGWNWPTELEEVLHRGWGDITQRPSMKEVNSVLKRALPKICPELNQPRAPEVPTVTSQPSLPSSISQPTQQISNRKGRSLFHRSEKKTKQKKEKANRGTALTPTKLTSDFSLTNDDDYFFVQ